MLDEFCGVSLDNEDDPTWDQAIKGNESQKWWDAGYEELANLDRFDVIEPIAADQVGDDEDIYDTMLCEKSNVVSTMSKLVTRSVSSFVETK